MATSRRDNQGLTLYYGASCPLSNMYRCSFRDSGGQTFTSSEQFYQREKALAFGDVVQAAKIMRSSDPFSAKRLGKRVKGFDDTQWRAGLCDTVMRDAVRMKFSQNIRLQNYLLRTQPTIGEASPSDKYFGIGLHLNAEKAYVKSNWTGQNMMGRILMELRGQFRARIQPTPMSGEQSVPLNDQWVFSITEVGDYRMSFGSNTVLLTETIVQMICSAEAIKNASELEMAKSTTWF